MHFLGKSAQKYQRYLEKSAQKHQREHCLYQCSPCHYANLNITIIYHIMSILLRRIPFQRTLQMRYRSCECPENSNALSTTFKVNVCTLFCTNVICGSIARAVYILKEDRMECEKRLHETK